MATAFQFERQVEFQPDEAVAILRQIPAGPGVFALFGVRATDQPYVTRAADMRRRVVRLVGTPDSQTKRLNLREKVARIAWTATGSEFESLLTLFRALSGLFGAAEARRRMRLHTPYFLRLTMGHEYPRVYSTNRLSKRNLAEMYGPFASRAAAERYCDAVLDLYRLRRCWEDLAVSPDHPGCAYGEMKKCMAPCNESCTAEEYAAEARAVKAFFDTRGESLLTEVGAARERASAEMEFEQAAALHERYQKVKAAAALADELVQPVSQVRAVIVQEAAGEGDAAAVFMVQSGCMAGPERLSTLGVRAVKEQTSVGSSLFAQPLMLQAVPLEGVAEAGDSPEVRAGVVLGLLQEQFGSPAVPADVETLSDHLSLLRRWYYRPEKQRAGEIFFPYPDGGWPVRRILRGAARMAIGEPKAMAETDRDNAAAAKVKILHEGRPDVERVVPVVKRRRGKPNTDETRINTD